MKQFQIEFYTYRFSTIKSNSCNAYKNTLQIKFHIFIFYFQWCPSHNHKHHHHHHEGSSNVTDSENLSPSTVKFWWGGERILSRPIVLNIFRPIQTFVFHRTEGISWLDDWLSKKYSVPRSVRLLQVKCVSFFHA